jgi:hypothetical protein
MRYRDSILPAFSNPSRGGSLPIRGSSNGARHTRPQARRGGRDRPEQVVVIDRNDWSSSIGTGGRHHPVRAHFGRVGGIRAAGITATRPWRTRFVSDAFEP